MGTNFLRKELTGIKFHRLVLVMGEILQNYTIQVKGTFSSVRILKLVFHLCCITIEKEKT